MLRRLYPSKEPAFGDLDFPLNSSLAMWMETEGRKLYLHQAEAMNVIRRGESVMLSTPTASGKSMPYFLLMLEKVLEDPEAKVLYLAPTKALCENQHFKFRQIADWVEMKTGQEVKSVAFTGGTKQDSRQSLLQGCQVFFSNPDIMHFSVLPNNASWPEFFQNLSLVIVDEAHIYRGAFGAEVAWVMRRIRRMVLNQGHQIQFFLCSATLRDAAAFGKSLTGESCVLVSKDGAPKYEKEFVVLEGRPTDLAVDQFRESMLKGQSTILFMQSRQAAEEVYSNVMDIPNTALYRGGLTMQERRAVEEGMFSGEIRGVVCTNALELGVDLPDFEVGIIGGYPGSLASFRQQAGRVARSRPGRIVWIADRMDPLEQYLAQHPDFLWDEGVEGWVLDLAKPEIMTKHLYCVTREKKVTDEEIEALLAPSKREDYERLVEQGVVGETKDGFYLKRDKYDLIKFSLRQVGEEYHLMALSGEDLGTVQGEDLSRFIFPGAIHLQNGVSYDVMEISEGEHRVYLTKRKEEGKSVAEVKEDFNLIVPKEELKIKEKSLQVVYGPTRWERKVVGVQYLFEDGKKKVPLDFPERVVEKDAVWLVLPSVCYHYAELWGVSPESIPHSLEHVLQIAGPLVLGCDRRELQGRSYAVHPQFERPAVMLFDSWGIYAKGFLDEEKLFKTLTIGYDLLSACPCTSGCPRCLSLAFCRQNNADISKRAAMLFLERLLDVQI